MYNLVCLFNSVEDEYYFVMSLYVVANMRKKYNDKMLLG